LAEISKYRFRLSKGIVVATILALKLLLRSKYVNLFHTYTYIYKLHRAPKLILVTRLRRESRKQD